MRVSLKLLYVSVRVSDDPLVVRMVFEPMGRPLVNENYYAEEKLNMCVVCGETEWYIRKNIVPHEYRKSVPLNQHPHTRLPRYCYVVKCCNFLTCNNNNNLLLLKVHFQH